MTEIGEVSVRKRRSRQETPAGALKSPSATIWAQSCPAWPIFRSIALPNSRPPPGQPETNHRIRRRGQPCGLLGGFFQLALSILIGQPSTLSQPQGISVSSRPACRKPHSSTRHRLVRLKGRLTTRVSLRDKDNRLLGD
jgi:hypothetical protein